MKRNIVFVLFVSSVVLLSCEKYEGVPNDSIFTSQIYDTLDKNATYPRQVRNDLYSYLPNGFNRIDNTILDAGTDDAVASRFGSAIELFSKSGITATINPDNQWMKCYTAIRKCNIFLSNIDQVPTNPSTISYWKAEARFIRAINYFELIKRYGGVPLVGDRVTSLDDDLKEITRNSYNEVSAYIVDECNSIIPLLKAEPVPDSELGTITRGAAYALKSRVLLYSASPLNNPQNDINKWQLAANAAKDLINLNVYKLEKSFTDVFLKRKSDEIILAYQRPQTSDLENLNAPVGFSEPNIGEGNVSPTQNLVNSFPMLDGRAINNSSTIYPYNAQDPYKNRDPRLAYTVFYNGSMWLSRPVETFEGGKDKPGGVIRQTRTGYYMRKFLGNFETAANYATQTHNFPIFRYAEILLNYAEAINETGIGTPQVEALNQLKLIRSRAGILAGAVAGYTYGLKTNMTQSELREAIQNERRIEMAFEEQRFWDIRRWNLAGSLMNGYSTGVKIVKNINGTLTYNYINVDKLTFTSKMYLYGIPQSDILSTSITQNPGY